jgi:hypothetical protein
VGGADEEGRSRVGKWIMVQHGSNEDLSATPRTNMEAAGSANAVASKDFGKTS